jgi:hypothetical protein
MQGGKDRGLREVDREDRPWAWARWSKGCMQDSHRLLPPLLRHKLFKRCGRGTIGAHPGQEACPTDCQEGPAGAAAEGNWTSALDAIMDSYPLDRAWRGRREESSFKEVRDFSHDASTKRWRGDGRWFETLPLAATGRHGARRRRGRSGLAKSGGDGGGCEGRDDGEADAHEGEEPARDAPTWALRGRLAKGNFHAWHRMSLEVIGQDANPLGGGRVGNRQTRCRDGERVSCFPLSHRSWDAMSRQTSSLPSRAQTQYSSPRGGSSCHHCPRL